MKKIRILVLVLCLVGFILGGCAKHEEIQDEGIHLQIQMNVEEDFGLLVIDYDANGIRGSGGTSQANKSLLKKNERIEYTLEKGWFEEPSQIDSLTLNFTIITEYVDPNYENIYPEEYTKTMPGIHLNVEMGETYAIEITGDKDNGYIATVK